METIIASHLVTGRRPRPRARSMTPGSHVPQHTVVPPYKRNTRAPPRSGAADTPLKNISKEQTETLASAPEATVLVQTQTRPRVVGNSMALTSPRTRGCPVRMSICPRTAHTKDGHLPATAVGLPAGAEGVDRTLPYDVSHARTRRTIRDPRTGRMDTTHGTPIAGHIPHATPTTRQA